MANSVAKRRAEKTAEIVACAWMLAREHGIAGVSLHGLAREVGMRQPSLYEYFDSKHALYDAMFADGNRQLLERLDAVTLSPEPREALKQWLHAFAAFGSEDAELLPAAVPPAHPRLHALCRSRTRWPRRSSAPRTR